MVVAAQPTDGPCISELSPPPVLLFIFKQSFTAAESLVEDVGVNIWVYKAFDFTFQLLMSVSFNQ